MRETYAHEATLRLGPDGDERAPGARVTVELCGSWSHDPPCPMAPHHTSVSRDADVVHVRTLFAAVPADEGDVRRRIDAALAGGGLTGPDGVRTTWQLLGSGPAAVAPAEADHAARLARS